MRMFSFFVVFAAFALSAQADEPVMSPYATGGEVTVQDLGNFRFRYIHVFTNTAEAATFANIGDRTLRIRYLVVGAGGFGIGGYSGNNGGGGGGGGGVCEKEDIVFASGATWSVTVGKGAASVVQVAGASVISNGTQEVELVPGGGNGGTRTASGTGVLATSGAGGGGGGMPDWKAGGKGTYQSSILGVVPAGTEPGKGFSGGTGTRCCAGGGGAGGKGGDSTVYSISNGNGGAGLASEITGESAFYGAGGGGGCALNGTALCGGGLGGSGVGGNGARYEFLNNDDGSITTNLLAATRGAANSGSGGGGGAMQKGKTAGAAGADGVVIIRYEVAESPCEGGDVITRTLKRGTTYTYLHKFTNVTEAAEFVNSSGRDLKIRYLVVGAGGFGIGGWGSNNGGGGGGGGGVCEKANVALSSGAVWSVTVGKGSTSKTSVAGASVISNGTEEIELVPGGGNGGTREYGGGTFATSGAGGGGGGMNDWTTPGVGIYQSSILGVTPTGTSPGVGFSGGTGARGGGGGGAGGKGGSCTASVLNTGNGGKGLASEITGESLFYGAGGGGGFGYGNNVYTGGGLGGSDSRGGDGARVILTKNEDGSTSTSYLKATAGAVNSGSGGGGGSGVSGSTAGARGADGVVIFRYDFNENPQGLMLIVR